MLKGQAKKDYQREYMRDYMRTLRSKGRLLRPDVKTLSAPDVMPDIMRAVEKVRAYIDADGNPVYEE